MRLLSEPNRRARVLHDREDQTGRPASQGVLFDHRQAARLGVRHLSDQPDGSKRVPALRRTEGPVVDHRLSDTQPEVLPEPLHAVRRRANRRFPARALGGLEGAVPGRDQLERYRHSPPLDLGETHHCACDSLPLLRLHLDTVHLHQHAELFENQRRNYRQSQLHQPAGARVLHAATVHPLLADAAGGRAGRLRLSALQDADREKQFGYVEGLLLLAADDRHPAIARSH